MAEWKESGLWMELAHQGAVKPQSHSQKQHLEEHAQPPEASLCGLVWCDTEQRTLGNRRQRTLLGRQNACHGAARPRTLTLAKPPLISSSQLLICKARVCEYELIPHVT